MEKWYARDTRRQRSRSFQRHVHRPTSNSSTDPVPCNHLSSPSREIQRSRTPDIYFGDSLSTGSPFKIECLYKSSPIRERVLNARTSPATKSQPEHPACPSSTLFPTTPFPGLSLPLPLYFTFPLPSSPFNRLYRYAGSTTHHLLMPGIGLAGLAFLLCILRREIR